jgi:hypothetical protein
MSRSLGEGPIVGAGTSTSGAPSAVMVQIDQRIGIPECQPLPIDGLSPRLLAEKALPSVAPVERNVDFDTT